MDSPFLNLILADILLVLHVIIVVFVVVGLVAVYVGSALAWSWVRNRWFRVTHVVAIIVATAQSWLGIICPLTTWEMSLRSRAGDIVYSGSFLSHWLETLLYYQAPAWVFTVVYTVFLALAVVSWIFVRPRPFGGT